jgi:PAS domain S-box-containing protein
MTRVAMLQVDGAGTVVVWSPSAEQLFGFGEAVAIGRNFWTSFAADEPAAWLPRLREAIDRGEHAREASFQRHDGERFQASVLLSALGTDRFAVVIVDRTEQMSWETREHARDRFFAALAHDLRQPISVITTVADLFERGGKRADLARRIRDNAARIEELTTELLEVGSVRFGGELALAREVVDLGELARETTRLLIPADRDRILLIEAGERSTGQWDRRLLRRIVQNLVENALTHSPPSSAVVLAWHLRGGLAILTIENQASQLNRAQLSTLFEPFRRAGSSGRVGLGLYIARELARAHGGDIAGSTRDGMVEFAVSLPREPPSSYSIKRRHPRTPLDTTLQIGVGERTVAALGRDISLRGLAFFSEAELHIDEWIKVVVDYDGGAFSVLGVVRHTERQGDRTLVGIEFPTDLCQADVDLIRNPPRPN